MACKFLKELAAHGDRTPTIVLTGFGSVEQAISLVHDLKAFWFLEKPVQPGVLRTLLERAIQQGQLVEETERLNRSSVTRAFWAIWLATHRP